MADPTAPPTFQYPFATSPDIIRSHQKDAYFQGVLLEQLSSILRRLKGARVAHAYTAETRTVSELLYFGLTTLIGNRTLGEEYCDIVQVEDDTLQLPHIARRAAYILTAVLAPYGLNRFLPAFRRRIRAKLEANLRRASLRNRDSKTPSSSKTTTLQAYLLRHLDTITSPSPIHALSLTIFYFAGSYYHLSKRLVGLRYLFTRRVAPSDQRVGYEVLGVLLLLQMGVQAYLHVQQTLRAFAGTTTAGTTAGTAATLDHGVEVPLSHHPNPSSTTEPALLFITPSPSSTFHNTTQRIAQTTHTPLPPSSSSPGSNARYDLTNPSTLSWIPPGSQQRACTLCLEPMRDPAVTACGHVFCWACVADWCREKPECPLCRQRCRARDVLPLRG